MFRLQGAVYWAGPARCRGLPAQHLWLPLPRHLHRPARVPILHRGAVALRYGACTDTISLAFLQYSHPRRSPPVHRMFATKHMELPLLPGRVLY
eukprot:COSAG05_NODE_109_length_18675_cov_6.774279_10_plen_94_part_00